MLELRGAATVELAVLLPVIVVIVLLALRFASNGYRQGFIISGATFFGFLGGAVIGIRLAPWAAEFYTDPLAKLIVVLVIVFALAIGGQAGMTALGYRLRKKLKSNGSKKIDHFLGPVIAVLAVVILATWAFTKVPEDVNWVFLPRHRGWTGISTPLWVALWIVVVPIVLYWPWHLVLTRPTSQAREGWGVHTLLFIGVVITMTLAGCLFADALPGDMAGWTPAGLLRAFPRGLSFSLPLLAILLTHEMGHYVTARRYQLSVSPPYFIPGLLPPWGIGTFGAFIRLRTIVNDRRQLLDVGAAGPIAGFVIALPILWYGLAISQPWMSSVEFKTGDLRSAKEKGWHGWQRDRSDARRKQRRPEENLQTETVIGFRPDQFLRYVEFERVASGLDCGERLLLSDRIEKSLAAGEVLLPAPGRHPLELQLGLPASDILDIIYVICLYNFNDRLADATGISGHDFLHG